MCPPARHAHARCRLPNPGGSRYASHPYRLATVLKGGARLAQGLKTIGFNVTGRKVEFGDGWRQGVMNVALLGLSDLAAAAVATRATTSSGAMRFPSYLPSMQDFRPNEDHLSNMRTALQHMLLQFGEADGAIALLPAWPCANWSVAFKLHAPKRTVIEGVYDHKRRVLNYTILPASRAQDVRSVGCQ